MRGALVSRVSSAHRLPYNRFRSLNSLTNPGDPPGQATLVLLQCPQLLVFLRKYSANVPMHDANLAGSRPSVRIRILGVCAMASALVLLAEKFRRGQHVSQARYFTRRFGNLGHRIVMAGGHVAAQLLKYGVNNCSLLEAITSAEAIVD